MSVEAINPVATVVAFVSRGRYDFASNKQQDQLVLEIRLTDGTRLAASDLFDVETDIATAVDLLDPSEVHRALSDRLADYWFVSDKEKRQTRLREMLPYLNWATVTRLEARLKQLGRELEEVQSRLEDAREIATEAA